MAIRLSRCSRSHATGRLCRQAPSRLSPVPEGTSTTDRETLRSSSDLRSTYCFDRGLGELLNDPAGMEPESPPKIGAPDFNICRPLGFNQSGVSGTGIR